MSSAVPASAESGVGAVGWRDSSRLQIPFVPRDVVPGPVLEADAAVYADGRESNGRVQAHARGIRQRDAGVRAVESLQRENPEQRGVERASDPRRCARRSTYAETSTAH